MNLLSIFVLALCVVVASVTLATVSNAGPQPPPFRWHHDMSFTDMASVADTIIVGVALSVTGVGPEVSGSDDNGNTGKWQLVRVRTTIENVLKEGIPKESISDSRVDFYFYLWNGSKMGAWNSVDVGARYVWFLVKDGGRLRAVRDYWRSSIALTSGRHRTLPQSGSVLRQLAILLLSPGDGMDTQQFVRRLSLYVSLANEWLGPCETLAHLRTLSHFHNARISSAATEEISARDNPNCSAP